MIISTDANSLSSSATACCRRFPVSYPRPSFNFTTTSPLRKPLLKVHYQGHYLFLALPVHHIENVSSVSAGNSDHHKGTAALLQTADIRERLQKRCDFVEAKRLVGQALTDLRILEI